MKNPEQWLPSKFVYQSGRLRGSRNPAHLDIASRLVADVVASYYDQYLRIHARGNLIDLGCGNVPLYAAYKDFITQNVCVDWENSMHENPFLDNICNLNERLPFGNEEFDTILLSDVLEHIPEPEKLWREMERILKPGGNIILNVPFFYKIHEAPHDYFRYTEFALRRFAQNANMEVRVLEPIGGIIEILGDLSAKLFLKIPLAGKMLAIVTQRIFSAFTRTSPGRKVSRKTSARFPLGYFMIVTKG